MGKIKICDHPQNLMRSKLEQELIFSYTYICMKIRPLVFNVILLTKKHTNSHEFNTCKGNTVKTIKTASLSWGMGGGEWVGSGWGGCILQHVSGVGD